MCLSGPEEETVESVWSVVFAIVPSIGVGFLFYKVLRAIIEGDRKERLAHAQWEASHPVVPGNTTSGAVRPDGGVSTVGADAAG